MVEISAREYSAARTQIRERGDRDIIYTTEETWEPAFVGNANYRLP